MDDVSDICHGNLKVGGSVSFSGWIFAMVTLKWVEVSVLVGGYCVFIDLIFAMVTLKWVKVSVVVGGY